MYESVRKGARARKDRLLMVTLLIALALVISVTPAMYTALRASYLYHCFVQDFADDLVYARRRGVIELTEGDAVSPVTADAVSGMFVQLTDCSFGQPLKQAPRAEHVTLSLPNGAVFSLYNTPEDIGEPLPSGVTVEYTSKDGKTFIYLQRAMRYENAVALLHMGT